MEVLIISFYVIWEMHGIEQVVNILYILYSNGLDMELFEVLSNIKHSLNM